MRYLDASLRLAAATGYLPLKPDTRWLRDCPGWLNSLQGPNGVQELERHLDVVVPASLKEFWSNPDLVRLLDSWRWQDFLDEEPRVVLWGRQKYIWVCSHPHSGGIGAVALGAGEDPPLCWGWDDEVEPMQPTVEAFSDFVYLSIKEGPGHN